jgi:hypothetical protein
MVDSSAYEKVRKNVSSSRLSCTIIGLEAPLFYCRGSGIPQALREGLRYIWWSVQHKMTSNGCQWSEQKFHLQRFRFERKKGHLIRQIHHVFHKPPEDDVSVEKTSGESQSCRSYPIAYLFLRAHKFIDPILFIARSEKRFQFLKLHLMDFWSKSLLLEVRVS